MKRGEKFKILLRAKRGETFEIDVVTCENAFVEVVLVPSSGANLSCWCSLPKFLVCDFAYLHGNMLFSQRIAKREFW